MSFPLLLLALCFLPEEPLFLSVKNFKLYYFCNYSSCLVCSYRLNIALGVPRACLLMLVINNLLSILWLSSGSILERFWAELLFILYVWTCYIKPNNHILTIILMGRHSNYTKSIAVLTLGLAIVISYAQGRFFPLWNHLAAYFRSNIYLHVISQRRAEILMLEKNRMERIVFDFFAIMWPVEFGIPQIWLRIHC